MSAATLFLESSCSVPGISEKIPVNILCGGPGLATRHTGIRHWTHRSDGGTVSCRTSTYVCGVIRVTVVSNSVTGHTATTIESGKTIRSRIQQTGANSQLESCCFTYKLSWDLAQVGSCLLNSGPDRFAAFNCCCSDLDWTFFRNFLISKLPSLVDHQCLNS